MSCVMRPCLKKDHQPSISKGLIDHYSCLFWHTLRRLMMSMVVAQVTAGLGLVGVRAHESAGWGRLLVQPLSSLQLLAAPPLTPPPPSSLSTGTASATARSTDTDEGSSSSNPVSKPTN